MCPYVEEGALFVRGRVTALCVRSVLRSYCTGCVNWFRPHASSCSITMACSTRNKKLLVVWSPEKRAEWLAPSVCFFCSVFLITMCDTVDTDRRTRWGMGGRIQNVTFLALLVIRSTAENWFRTTAVLSFYILKTICQFFFENVLQRNKRLAYINWH